MMARGKMMSIAGALLALPLLTAPAAAKHHHGDKGKDAAAKPGAPAKASTERAPQKVGTPSAAYPGAPGGTPAAGDAGKPVEPKP